MNGKRTNRAALCCIVSALWVSGCGQEAAGPGAAAEDAVSDAGESAARDSDPAPPATPAADLTAAEAGRAFLAENGKRAGVVTTISGLQYEVLASDSGASPGPTDRVTTHYHGTLTNGRVFDSSMQRGEPIEFPVNGVISGWTEALQLMQVGGRWKLYIPPELAYGKRGAGGVIGPDETLVFEVELLEVRPG